LYGFTIINGEDITKISLPSCKRSIIIEFTKNSFFFFGYNFFEKFKNDKIFEEGKGFVIGIDGVLLNLQKLKNSYGISNYFSLIKTLFEKYGIGFASQLKGEFNGFIFDKNSLELFFFNNKTGTKQAFYSSIKGCSIISESVANIVSFKKRISLPSSLNVDAAYNMLTFGMMMQDETLVTGVRKLLAGKYLFLKNAEIIMKEYFTFNNVEYSINSKKEAIHRIDETINEAIKLEYEKDIEYNYNHIATLSGGLDSRVNVMLAYKLGYKNKTFCFSEPNYLDEIISNDIATSLGLEHQFISLNGGVYMKDLEENASIINGTQIFTGAAHYNYSLYQTNLNNYGLIHTGQIGDGILGGLLTKGEKQHFFPETKSNLFLDKIKISQTLFDSYKNEEVFKLYHRVFNLTHSGSYTTEFHKTYLVSPFLDDDVILTALAIAPKLKYNQNIYIDWVLNRHPEITNFIWERTGFKPNKKWKTNLSRYTKKIKKEYLNFTNQKEKLSMAPEDYWLESNTYVKEFYANYFNKNINLIESNKEFFKDITSYYSIGNSIEKAIVLTILETVRKFELKV
jgi:asparagine synthase (glutamine-hydrolysing)